MKVFIQNSQVMATAVIHSIDSEDGVDYTIILESGYAPKDVITELVEQEVENLKLESIGIFYH